MNRRIYNLFLVAFLCLVVTMGYSQSYNVSGTVTDESGGPLIGVNIIIMGTSNGTISDLDGSFSLELDKPATLAFSYTGYLSSEIDVSGDNSALAVVMKEDVAKLDEVIVTGLASGVKRSNSGNSIASVSGDELTGNTSPQTLDNALFGKIPGVNMSANGGAPGGGINVQLRGISTLGAGESQPLYIVDGVYVDNSSIRTGRTQVNGASGGQSAATQDDAANRIADINPDDIEKIEVLKGPSAAAIYGTRANSGVIIITTKKGKAGETNISFSQDIGVASAQNLQGFGIWSQARTDAYSGSDPGELAAQAAAEAAGRNIDWEDFFYGENPLLSNTQLSISGGSEKTQFRVAGGILTEDGIIKNTGFDRYSVRVNLDHKLTKKLKVSLSTAYNKTNTDRGFTGNQNNTGGSIGYALAYTPSYADLLPDDKGNYPINPYFNDNPVAIRDLGINNQTVDRYFAAGSVEYDIFSNDVSFFKFRARGGADYLSGNSLVYFPEQLQHQAALPNPGDVMWGRQDNLNTNLEAFLIYNRQLGTVNSNTTAGYIYLDQESEFLLTRGRGLSGGQTNLQWATVQSVQDQTNQEVNDVGIVVQEDLNWDDKIALSLGIRMDKSTLNLDHDEFYFFPKASVAFNIHEFDFFESSIINSLKIRSAYGETGGLPKFGNTFESLSPQLVGGSLGGQVGTRAVDPNLVPETSREIEFGIDASFWDNRIFFEATYYNKEVKDLIFDVTPPESTGITAIATNAGDLTNKGFELSLGVNSVRTDNVNITTHFTFFRNESEITRWDVPAQTIGGFGPSLGTYLFAKGFSPTTIVGTPSGSPDSPLGFTVYGDRQPDFTMTMGNEINIMKNWDLSFLLHWQKGGSAINLSALLWDDGGTTPNWDGDDDGDGTPNGLDRLLDWAANGNTGAYIEETSYVKLREIGLYYTLPKGILGETFKRLKLGVSANNVLLWTNYGSYDPEVSNFGVQSVTGNIEVTPYPSSRRFFFHLKADF